MPVPKYVHLIHFILILQALFLQVTFSEKGTKISCQTRIQKFEILEISPWNRFHSAIFPSDWRGTLF